MNNTNSRDPPAGWTDDNLTKFLEETYRNQWATFARKKTEFILLKDVDEAFYSIAQNLINPKNLLTASLLIRSHSAFRAACSAAMAGLASETFVLLRSCLEYAGYGLMICRQPHLGAVWLQRHDSEDALRKMKREFLATNIETTIRNADAKLSQIYVKLYQRTIDFGAHPNERGVLTSVDKESRGTDTNYRIIYRHGDSLAMDHALLSTAQTGLCSLHVFQKAFPERFLVLGLRDRLISLRGRCR